MMLNLAIQIPNIRSQDTAVIPRTMLKSPKDEVVQETETGKKFLKARIEERSLRLGIEKSPPVLETSPKKESRKEENGPLLGQVVAVNAGGLKVYQNLRTEIKENLK